MHTSQPSNSVKRLKPVTNFQRIIAGLLFLAVLGIFLLLWASCAGWIEMRYLFGVCGFKQTWGLPCPGCYITRSAQAFAQGRIAKSFYIQPAGAVLCCVLAVTGVFSLLIAGFGVDFGVLAKLSRPKVLKYSIILAVIVFLSSWAVTLARELAQIGP